MQDPITGKMVPLALDGAPNPENLVTVAEAVKRGYVTLLVGEGVWIDKLYYTVRSINKNQVGVSSFESLNGLEVGKEVLVKGGRFRVKCKGSKMAILEGLPQTSVRLE